MYPVDLMKVSLLSVDLLSLPARPVLIRSLPPADTNASNQLRRHHLHRHIQCPLHHIPHRRHPHVMARNEQCRGRSRYAPPPDKSLTASLHERERNTS